MSAGHHIETKHSPAVRLELQRVLKDPRVKKLLAKPYKVDFSHPMPLTGGSSVAWGTFFLDPKLKKRFTVGNKHDLDLSGPVLRHEMVEKALRVVFGMTYSRAHTLATAAERIEVEKMGVGWAPYKNVMESLVRTDEHEQVKSLPKGYDTGPLRESKGVKSLDRLRRVAA